MESQSGHQKDPQAWPLTPAFTAWVMVSGSLAVLLTSLLLRINTNDGGITHVVGIFVSMFWVVGALSVVPLLASFVVWPLFARRVSAGSRSGAFAYFLSAVLAFNVAWILWNHLQMAHQIVSVRAFITMTGIVEIVAIALVALLIWLSGARILGPRGSTRLIGLGTALAIATFALMLDAKESTDHRVFPHAAAVAEARERAQPSMTPPHSHPTGPLILIGIDGLSWPEVHSLVQQGKLPTLAKLVASGTSGSLSNGNQSFSPPIWTTIYTGRKKEVHGIHGYRRVVVSASGEPVPNLRMLGDYFDVFYGLQHILQRLPSLGLWSIETVSSHDRRTPPIWDVVSSYKKRVVVANPLVSLPLSPVNGAIVSLDHSWKRGPVAYQPESLAADWGKLPLKDLIQDDDETFDAHADRLAEEVTFILDLFRTHEVDLGIFYTHFLDSVSHFNWDFYARDKFFLGDLPSGLSNDEWAKVIEENAADRAFRCYKIVDEQLRRFVDAFPNATFLVVSDHGWTYSGYEHFGSPDGVIIASGPDVRRGQVIVGATIEDIMPTLISRLQIPLSRELTGKPLNELFFDQVDSGFVASYNDWSVEPQQQRIEAVDDEDAERLRAIGYIE